MNCSRNLSPARRWLLIAVLWLALLAAGCTEQKKAAAAPPVPVTVATVVTRDVPVQVKAVGNVEAYKTVQIKSLVEGQLVSVHFREGQDVEKGQLLFTIDKAPFEAALHQAQSMLQRDEAQAADARSQAERYQQLLKEGVVARQQADSIAADANAKLAAVAADRAAVEQAQLKLQYCSIYAPIAGRTGNLMVHEGNLVKANGDNPLVTINQIAPVYGTFSVPEKQLGEIKRRASSGQLEVEARIPGDNAAAFGALSFVDNAVDTATGMIKLKGTFANGDRRLWPGQYVDIVLTLSTLAHAVVVPSAAVQTGQQGDFVFVVKPDKTAELRLVQIARSGDGVAIVTPSAKPGQGVQPGESVVTDGQLRLTSGSKVEIKQVNAVNVPSAPRSGISNGDRQADVARARKKRESDSGAAAGAASANSPGNSTRRGREGQ
jgi:multidrug efflux system membrane fusion protein